MLVDGTPNNSFQFVPNTNKITTKLKLNPGTHKIIITAKNDCGEDTQTAEVIVEEPCSPPVIRFSISEISHSSFTHQITGTVTNTQNKSDITVLVDGVSNSSFQFVPNTNTISSTYSFEPGTHTIKITSQNDCGNDTESAQIIVKEPCLPAVVTFSVSESNASGYTHQLSGTITNISNKNNITILIDGNTNDNFDFNTYTNNISSAYNFSPGTHTIKITAINDCSQDTESTQITIDEGPCGPRFNPGNADWQFCLITPSGTYNRSDLTSNSFTYSGSASSVFFKVTAGGGDAIINGSPYSLVTGKYYLFTGSLKVNVSTSNPGSMGQWSICIEGNSEPEYGIGNSMPTSPCASNNDDDGKGNTNDGRNGSGNTNVNSGRNNNTNRTNTGNTNVNSGRNNNTNRTNTENTNVNSGRNNNTNRTNSNTRTNSTNTNSNRSPANNRTE